MKNNVTIEDIAKDLGISKATVSRAISGKGRVSESTREAVLRVMEQMDYHPSNAPHENHPSQTKNIAAIMPSDYANTSSSFFLECLYSIFNAANISGYDVIVTSDSLSEVTSVERLISGKKVDGVILLRSNVLRPCEKLLNEHEIPYVLIGAASTPGIYHIDNDNIAASRELTEHLLNLGCERIAFLGPDINAIAFNHRMKGFVEAHRSSGREVDAQFIHMNLKNEQLVAHTVQKMMSSSTPPDAIITADDTICYWALTNLESLGVRIPEDIRIASFNDSIVMATHQPPITAVNINPGSLGDRACRILLSIISGQPVPEHNIVPYEIVLRRSTL